MTDTLLDIHELQRRLACGRSAAYALVATGVLPTVRVGRAVRVSESALAAFIRDGGERHIPHLRASGNGSTQGRAAKATKPRTRRDARR